MAENEPENGKKWITVNGRRIEVDPDQSAEEAIREKLPDTRGDKEKNTKESLRKSLVKRFNLRKSKFNFRDEVLYDDLQKSGTIMGFDGTYVQIFTKGNRITRYSNDVFKKSELINNMHWDLMTIDSRAEILRKSNISQNYVRHDWAGIPAIIQDKIQKDGTPAGTGITTTSEGVWNPVNTDKTVDKKIKESMNQNEKEQRD